MIRKKNAQMDFVLTWLPPEIKELNPELSFIDDLLDEDRFLKPFESFFSQNMGRPSIPMETYLRLMYLKFRFRLGFETLEEAVNDSIKWRIFCHIHLSSSVPDASTLEKLTTLFGPETIDTINQELLKKLKEKKIITGDKLRLDSTVMESNIHYPTDATLLGDCARVLIRHLKRLKKSGAKITFRNSRRRIKKLLQSFGRGVANRTKKAKKQAHTTVKKMVEIVKHIISETEHILQKVQRVYKKKKETVFKTSIQILKKTVEITHKIIRQAESVISGNPKIPDRIVSIRDTDARPIVKGKAGKPVQFGYKVVLQESDNVITGYDVKQGNPGDVTLLSAIKDRHDAVFDHAPKEISADCGFASADNENLLKNWGVDHIGFPQRGKKSKERKEFESQYWYRKLRRFQAGMEGRISVYKLRFAGNRTYILGLEGTKTWTGWGVFGHNLWRSAFT